MACLMFAMGALALVYYWHARERAGAWPIILASPGGALACGLGAEESRTRIPLFIRVIDHALKGEE